MFHQLHKITEKPALYAFYTAETLWNDPYISRQMLKAHLDPESDRASRNHKFIDSSSAFLKERFDLGEGKSVLDFGCGPGLYTSRFAQLGCRVRGLDFSANSISYARQEAEKSGLEIEYLQQNYLEYEPSEKFDLVTMIFCDYCVLSDSQREKLLKIMKGSLKKGGHIFLDVCTEHMYERIEEGTSLQKVEKDGFWSAAPHFEFTSSFKYDENRVSLEKYTIIEEGRTFEIYNWLKHFTPEELEREFEESGLEIIEMYPGFGGQTLSGQPEVMAVAAREL